MRHCSIRLRVPVRRALVVAEAHQTQMATAIALMVFRLGLLQVSVRERVLVQVLACRVSVWVQAWVRS